MIPEGQGHLPELNAFRIRPTAHEPDPYTSPAPGSRRVTFEGLPAPAADEEVRQRGAFCVSVNLCIDEKGIYLGCCTTQVSF